MRTLVFCTSYINTPDAWNSRYSRWLKYYEATNLHRDITAMIDDGAVYTPEDQGITIAGEKSSPQKDFSGVLLYRFDKRLGRISVKEYPGWWRSFLKSVQLARYFGADKIIHIESDAFLLSQRLIDFLNKTNSGWHVMWSNHYQFPETAIQLICKDQFEIMENFADQYNEKGALDIAEKILPFTEVHKEFTGDRYSEVLRKRRGIFRSRKFDRFKIFRSNSIFRYMPYDADFATQFESWQKLPSTSSKE